MGADAGGDGWKAKWALLEDTPQASRYRQGAYVIRPNFTVFGVEAVIRELKAWARREARNYRQSPRAKAAEPPFDLLKWLAVYRLEEKRREVGITYEAAQESLRAYREGDGASSECRVSRLCDPWSLVQGAQRRRQNQKGSFARSILSREGLVRDRLKANNRC